MDSTAQAGFCPQRFLILLMSFSVFLGLCYSFLVPPGLPYDEPAHFSNVRYYAHWAKLPVLGQPGVEYEAYQAPLYYMLAATFYKAFAFAGAKADFYALRLAGVLLLVVLLGLTHGILRRIFSRHPLLSAVSCLFVALNPSLLAIASSIQNDMLSITLAVLAIYLSIRLVIDAELTLASTLLLAGVVSLAILTKISTAFLVLALPTFMIYKQRQRALRFALLFFLTVTLMTGWMFVRNVRLYGDITGAKAEKEFVGAEKVSAKVYVYKPRVFLTIMRSLVTYCWLPVEYYRNKIKAGPVAVVLVGLFTALGLVGCVVRGRLIRRDIASNAPAYDIIILLCMLFTASFLLYSYNAATNWMLPARILLPVGIVPMTLISAGGALLGYRPGHRGNFIYPGMLCGVMLLLNALILWQAAGLGHYPFIIHFE